MTRFIALLTTALLIGAVGCQSSPNNSQVAESTAGAETDLAVATFAGGCFWCMQPPFDRLEGVSLTVVGYTGGTVDEPSYEQVSAGATDHLEAVEVRYDPDQITYEELLQVFWRSIDPTDGGGQFADRGPHYRTAVFYHEEEQRRQAEKSRQRLAEEGPFDAPIVTEIEAATTFWIAEDYHQAYYQTNPERYERYYVGSGRAGFLDEVWGSSR